MGKRVLVAVVFVPVIFLVIYFCPPICLPIAVAVLSMLAVHEALWSTGFVKHARISGYSILLAGVIPFWVYYDGRPLPALCGLFVYVMLLFCEAIASHREVTLEKMGGAFFLSVMIPFFSDAFALFAGMLFGRHKLAPELSPKKTVEGAVGGLFGAVAFLLLYGAILQFGFHIQVNYALLALYGLLGSVLSQLGDLSFSYIKREYGIKDFGNIFPGHGGVLVRFDSVIFCAPLIELLIRFLPAIGG